MKIAAFLLALSGALRAALGLMVQLSEQDPLATIGLEDSPRSIPLVVGHTYYISCEGEWYRDDAPVTSDVPATGSSAVYTKSIGNSMELRFQLFSKSLKGQYVCRDDNEKEFTLNISTGNPVLIATRHEIGLEAGFRSAGSPALNVFGSGTPQPSVANYSWYFNDEPLFVNGVKEDDVTGYVEIHFNTIFLHQTISVDVEGVYVSVLNTSAGEVNVTIQLNVEVEPSPEEIDIISPANYSDDFLANGESVTFKCSDVTAVPVPCFTWVISGNDVTHGDEGISISSGNDGHESYLTISPVNQTHGGAEVMCVVSNVVEDSLRESRKKIDLTVLTPPPPPTNLTAVSLTSCLVQLSWLLPSVPPPNEGLSPECFLIEAQAGSDDWRRVGADMCENETSAMVDISIDSGGMRNVIYNFRISSGNMRGGASSMTTQSSKPVQLYYDDLPVVSSLSVSPLTSPPSSLSLSWSNPPSNCYQFLSHVALCKSTDDSGEGNMTTVGGDGSRTNVTGLAVDRPYTCSVTSNVGDAEGNVFSITSSSDTVHTFTYPGHPMAPPHPKTASIKSPTNITVHFVFAPDHSSISHYQILVVRVRDELPSGHPDKIYPAGFQFSTGEAVNNRKSEKAIHDPYIAAEVATENISTIFIIGSNLTSSPNSKYRNGPLLSGTKYTCFLRAFPKSHVQQNQSRRQTGERQYVIFSSSAFMDLEETDADDSSSRSSRGFDALLPGIVVGVIVAILLVVVIVLLVIIIYTCRRQRKSRQYPLHPRTDSSLPSYCSSKGSLDIPEVATPDLCRKASGMEMKPLDFSALTEDEEELIPSGAIPVNMFQEHVEKFDENRQLLFQLEFDWIQVNAPTSASEASNLPINDDKNRYSNIIAFDHSRVMLTPVDAKEGSDYINANYIPGFKRTREYISTQGPLEQTVVDFWCMVWEQNTATIVMLTNLVELGKVKCAQYWPSPTVGTLICGDVEITLDNVVELRDYTIRNFTVKHIPTSDQHTVLQFHYTKWPDYGTPKLASPLLNFLRAVHTSNPPEAGPIVVHCSAGVGRSGTVLSIDYCLCQLKADHVIDVRGFVSRMREHRNYMVQTETQYAFIHYAVLEALTYGDTSFPLSEFSVSYQHLQQKNKDSGQTPMEEEYAKLGSVKAMSKLSTFIQRVKQKGPTNRSIHFPGHASYSEGGSPHEYNAHYVDAYFTPKLFIVADGPEESTIVKFWQMVWDQDCSCLIMLTPLDAHYYSYWPGKGEQETFGNIQVEVEEETAEHYYTIRVISLSNAKIGISQKVTQYQFVGWTTQFLPPVSQFISFVCDVLKGVDTLQKKQKALVHDMKSLGPSGIFCSLCFCIERLRVERMVDVFQAVQNMQLQRPGTVQSMHEYAFIYNCVHEFIRTHSTS